MHYLDYAGIYVQGCPRGSRGGGSGIGRSRGVCGLSSFFPPKVSKNVLWNNLRKNYP